MEFGCITCEFKVLGIEVKVFISIWGFKTWACETWFKFISPTSWNEMLRCFKNLNWNGALLFGDVLVLFRGQLKNVGKVILMMINGEGMVGDSGLMIGRGKEQWTNAMQQ